MPGTFHIWRRFIPAHAGNTYAPNRHPLAPSVHPRACGEHSNSHGTAASHRGSSPRMRGTLFRSSVCMQLQRFIPAHAGNTAGCATTETGLPVHPRACGEHWPSIPPVACICGSSPRMRGTLKRWRQQLPRRRFIPAHAGNTRRLRSRDYSSPVHPRACGEHLKMDKSPAPCVGSSPRMRGTHQGLGAVGVPGRFIPAHAGNTPCGKTSICSTSGSSPRMRGTLVDAVVVRRQARFIPAHAGNTGGASPAIGRSAVHPRACGEHSSACFLASSSAGSSPRMRGTPRRIPSRAHSHSVHPRACGEHSSRPLEKVLLAGSSPRMRGTLDDYQGRGMQIRFIPAHAGNTFVPVIGDTPAPVHPRACGEHLTRGSIVFVVCRFIPAHAGNTAS